MKFAKLSEDRSNRKVRAKTTVKVELPTARGNPKSDDNTWNDTEKQDNGLRRRVKILRKVTKFSALRLRANNPRVDVVG